MNRTRRDWSSDYKCCRDKRDSLTAFFSLAAAIIIIAISFYCAVYFVGMKNPQTEPIDAGDLGRRRAENNNPSVPGPSSSSAVVDHRQGSDKKLIINKDDSDDELLVGASPVVSQNQN